MTYSDGVARTVKQLNCIRGHQFKVIYFELGIYLPTFSFFGIALRSCGFTQVCNLEPAAPTILEILIAESRFQHSSLLPGAQDLNDHYHT